MPDGLEVPIVQTPRGGRHYFFRYCPELYSRNAAQESIDVKSAGGYVLTPPSRTDRGAYAWHATLNLDTIPERPSVPKELVGFLKATPGPFPTASASPLTKGNRDNDLFHVALQLFKDGRKLDEVERIVVDMAKVCKPPFPEREALAKVKSAYDRFTRQRQGTGEAVFSALKRTFSDCAPEPVRWLMKDKVPLGMLTVFIGNPGEGKTFLAIELASRLSRGDAFPGYPHALAKGSTVFVSAENALNYILVPRAIACGADRTKLIHMPTVKDDERKSLSSMSRSISRRSRRKSARTRISNSSSSTPS